MRKLKAKQKIHPELSTRALWVKEKQEKHIVLRDAMCYFPLHPWTGGLSTSGVATEGRYITCGFQTPMSVDVQDR